MSHQYLFRFIIIGDSGVGKSCILRRFKTSDFSPHTLSTVGVEFIRKDVQINSEKIKIQVWDTAGQENMQSMTRSYFKSCCAVLITFDTTKRKSFENLNKWFENIDDNVNPNVKKILIGNKVDLEFEREVSRAEGEAFARSKGIGYVETSAREGVGVGEVFERLAHEVYFDVKKGVVKASEDGVFGVKYGEGFRGVREEGDFVELGGKTKEKKKGCCW